MQLNVFQNSYKDGTAVIAYNTENEKNSAFALYKVEGAENPWWKPDAGSAEGEYMRREQPRRMCW
jgi:hypothetical protein